MKVSVLPVFATAENDTGHLARGQFVHRTGHDQGRSLKTYFFEASATREPLTSFLLARALGG
jgi:hypothetical protein